MDRLFTDGWKLAMQDVPSDTNLSRLPGTFLAFLENCLQSSFAPTLSHAHVHSQDHSASPNGDEGTGFIADYVLKDTSKSAALPYVWKTFLWWGKSLFKQVWSDHTSWISRAFWDVEWKCIFVLTLLNNNSLYQTNDAWRVQKPHRVLTQVLSLKSSWKSESEWG